MPFKYEPVAATDLLPPGEYDATIEHVKEKQSKSGNDMLELSLHVYAPDGEPIPVYDYLVATSSAAWKVRAFCEALGLDYDAGELNPDALVDKNIRVKIVTEEQAGYEPKAKVKNYLPPGGKSESAPAKLVNAATLKDDDIPF